MYNDGDKAFGTAADLCVQERMQIALEGLVIVRYLFKALLAFPRFCKLLLPSDQSCPCKLFIISKHLEVSSAYVTFSSILASRIKDLKYMLA